MPTYSFKFIRITYFTLFIFLLGCKKDKSNTVAPSSYFEAEINGIKWQGNSNMEATLTGTMIFINGRNKEKDDWTDIGLHIPTIDLTNPNKSYSLGLPNGSGGIGTYSINSNYSASIDYSTGYPNGGTITITSYTNSIIEGTFSFKAKATSNNSLVNISKGRFKVPVRINP